MADNPLNYLVYLKDKFPVVNGIRFAPRPNGTVLYLDLTTHTREEFFKDLGENQLRQLVKQTWPDLFRTADGAEELQIFNNGKLIPLTGVADLDAAHALIRQLEIELDEMITVKDTNGQVVARYISNKLGQIRKLED